MQALTNNWTYKGSWQAGTISTILLSPSFDEDGVALAASGAALFRTETAGQQWSPVTNGLSDHSMLALAAGRTSAGILFLASSEQGRLFRSVDLGASWSEILTWAGLGVGVALAISPDYASDKTFFIATANGVFRTLDDGVTYQEASFGLLDLDVISLTIASDFAHSQMLWAGTALGGLFRTRNAGRAWRESGDGLPDCAVQAIQISPNFAHDQTVYAGMEMDGVYLTQDAGRSWSAAGEALQELGVNALATVVDEASPVGYRLLAGTAAGIYSSLDGAATWTLELADLPVLDLALSANGAGLAATYQEGIYRRDLNSGEWQAAASGIVAHAPPQVIGSQRGPLLALDNDGELAIASDGGATWQPLPSPDEDSPVVAIGYASVAGEGCFYAASLANLYLLPVEQAEWHRLLEPPLRGADTIIQMAVATHDERLQIAIGSAEGAILRLDDTERRWQQLEQPWRNVHLLSLFFAADAQGTDCLCALTAAENAQHNYDLELWRYDQEWSSLAGFESESPAVLPLAVGQSILLATQHRLIRLFTQAESGELDVTQHFFAEGSRITALATASTDGTLYLATTTALYASSDKGVTWEELSKLPCPQPIVSILSRQGESLLTVITLGGEVWSFEL